MAVLVERDHIGIFGKMNSGKSSLMNLLTQQGTSIVDASPGTTADTKIALQEIHGLGPVKLFDTAGADEGSGLGEKKRKKVFSVLQECDLVLLVINPATRDFSTEGEILDKARESDKQILAVYNLFHPEDAARISEIEKTLPLLRFTRKIRLRAVDKRERGRMLDFILEFYESRRFETELFPFLERDEFYILIIPMDVETPSGRFLRPQAMSEEYITRHWAWPVCFRLDLGKARSADPAEASGERARFDRFVNGFGRRPKAMITDSQAMDIMHRWCPPGIGLTTFSIAMIHYVSRGRLNEFARGIQALDGLEAGDRILIAEACNHSRVGEDIGTVQIPRFFSERFPGVTVEHNFGREFQENRSLAAYKLIIHCGGCMISSQKMLARIRDLETVGVPFTNYGLFLAAMQGRAALRRVLEPWGLGGGVETG
jgi:small GTP-binding protein